MASVEHLRRAFVVARAAAILVLGCVLSVLLIGNANLAQDGGGGGENGNGGPPEVVGTQNLTDDTGFEQIVADPDAMDESSGGGPGNAPGRVKIMLPDGPGNAPLVTLLGKQNHDRFGYSISATMDYNYDGHVDVVVGAPSEELGRAYVFFGPFPGGNGSINAAQADLELISPLFTGYHFGEAVGPITDFNDDGFPDIRVRQKYINFNLEEVHRTFIFDSVTGLSIGYYSGDDSIPLWDEVDGDLDGDGDVDDIDLLLMAERIGLTGPHLTARDGDLNADGVIDSADMGEQLNSLGADLFGPMAASKGGGEDCHCESEPPPGPFIPCCVDPGICCADDPDDPGGGGGGGGTPGDPDCGNGICEAGEDAGSCPDDCGSLPDCGNGVCDQGENSFNCPRDCTISTGDCPPLTPRPGDEPGYVCIGKVICMTIPGPCAGTPSINGPACIVPNSDSTCDDCGTSSPVQPGEEFCIAFCGPGQVTISYSPDTTDSDCDCVTGPLPLVYDVAEVDLDVDSRNDGFIDEDDDDVEDDDDKPGNFIIINNGDVDGDGIPDFADGYDFNSDVMYPSDDLTAGAEFVPILFKFAHLPPDEEPIITFGYGASDPMALVTDGAFHEPAAGSLRIWNAPADAERDGHDLVEGGNFVSPDAEYSFEDFGLDPDAESGMMWLFVEAVKGSSVIGGEVITVQIGNCKDTIRLTSIGTQLVEPNGTGGFDAVQYPALSHPTPIIQVNTFAFTNLRPNADYQKLLADISIAGQLDDAASDMMEGPESVIATMNILLDGEPIPLDGGQSHHHISVGYTKSAGQQDLFKPYDYSGWFSTTLTDIEVSPGWNTITLNATNGLGFTGYAEREFEILTEADAFTVTIDLELYGGDVSSAVQMFLRLERDSDFEWCGFLDRQQDGSFLDSISGTSVVIADLVLDEPPDVNDFVLFVTHDIGESIRLHDDAFLVTEKPLDSGFEGSRTFEQFELPDWWGHQMSLSSTSSIEQSMGGEFRPFFREILGPPELQDLFADLTTTFDNGGQQQVRIFDLVQHGDHMLAGISGGLGIAEPHMAVQDVFATGLLPADRRDGTLNFLQGFGGGLTDTGVAIVDSVGSLGKGAWYLVKNYNTITVIIRVVSDGQLITEEDQRRISVTYDAATLIGDFVYELMQNQEAVAIALLTGDMAALSLLSEEHRLAGEFLVELIEAADEAMLNMDDHDVGRIMGRIIGEVIVEVALAATTAGAGNAIRKAAISARVIEKSADLAGGPIPPPVVNAITNLTDYFVGMSTTKICFVAGTPVLTRNGLITIEEVGVGNEVWSRDENSGAMGWQPVTATIRTHPETLYHLAYQPSETSGVRNDLEYLTGTGEHPIFVVNRNEFVPMAALRTGELLLLGDGISTAHIIDVQVERGPPSQGAVFTTYNLEVSNYHTYFVGESSVWVHNQAAAPCERVFSIYRRIQVRDDLMDDPVEAWRRTLQKFATITGRKMNGNTVRSATIDVMKQIYDNPPTLPNGGIDFEKISWNKMSIAWQGHLEVPDLENHHTAVWRFAERMYELQFGQPPPS